MRVTDSLTSVAWLAALVVLGAALVAVSFPAQTSAGLAESAFPVESPVRYECPGQRHRGKTKTIASAPVGFPPERE